MKEITLEVESYLFESEGGSFRTVPFYELSITEWVIFEGGKPTYYLDFNRKEDPIIR